MAPRCVNLFQVLCSELMPLVMSCLQEEENQELGAKVSSLQDHIRMLQASLASTTQQLQLLTSKPTSTSTTQTSPLKTSAATAQTAEEVPSAPSPVSAAPSPAAQQAAEQQERKLVTQLTEAYHTLLEQHIENDKVGRSCCPDMLCEVSGYAACLMSSLFRADPEGVPQPSHHAEPRRAQLVHHYVIIMSPTGAA